MDKYVYGENEITIVESQCELCDFYNEGNYSENCPKDNMTAIRNNEYRCPNKRKKSFFDDYM